MESDPEFGAPAGPTANGTPAEPTANVPSNGAPNPAPLSPDAVLSVTPLGAGVVRRTTVLADGRDLVYYDDPGTALGAERRVDARILDPRPDTAAMRQDVLTGERSEIESPTDPTIRRHIARIMLSYGQLSPGRLVDISHAKDAPWHYIADKGRTSVALGLRIPDDVIVNRFKFHKVSIGAAPVAGEPDEDTPLT